MDDVDADLGLVHLVQLALQRLDGADGVGLDDEVELGELVRLDAGEQVVQADVARSLLLGHALLELALLRKAAGLGIVLEDGELVACRRDGLQAEDLDRVGRLGLVDVVALRVDERADAAIADARDQ